MICGGKQPAYTIIPSHHCCCNVILDLTSVYSQAEQSFPYEVLCQRVPTNIGNILSLEFDHAPCLFYV